MEKEMSVTEYKKKLIEQVEAFAEDWIKRRKKDPKSYPAKLTEGDWFEQFMSYQGME